MRIVFLLILFIMVLCQEKSNSTSPINDIKEEELTPEFYECLEKNGLDIEFQPKKKNTNDNLIKKIMDSFLKKIEKKDEEIIKKCRKKNL